MPAVIAVEIVIVAEVTVLIAPVPVARCRDTVNQAAMMQHWQIEASAVPRHELRRVAVDAIEKTTDQLRLGIGGLAQRPDAKHIAFTQGAGDGDDALQIQRQEVTAGRRAALLRRPGEYVRLG